MRRLYTGGRTFDPSFSNGHGNRHDGPLADSDRVVTRARAVVYDAGTQELHVTDLGDRSTSEAEYAAIIKALEYARDNALTEVRLLTDSQQCYFEIVGKWPIRQPRQQGLVDLARGLLGLVGAEFSWIPPEDNPAGHVAHRYLARHGREAGHP